MKHVILAIILVSALFGCAEVPQRIAHPPSDDLQFDKALFNIKENIGQQVRWGGTVLTVSEKDEKTWIEIRQYRLADDGAPQQIYDSKGRFIIKAERLTEKLSSLIGMDVTVYGELSDSFEGSIGHVPYLFPVVDAAEYYLWGAEHSSAYSAYYPNCNGYGYYIYPSTLYPYPYSYIYRGRFDLYRIDSCLRYRHSAYYY